MFVYKLLTTRVSEFREERLKTSSDNSYYFGCYIIIDNVIKKSVDWVFVRQRIQSRKKTRHVTFKSRYLWLTPVYLQLNENWFLWFVLVLSQCSYLGFSTIVLIIDIVISDSERSERCIDFAIMIFFSVNTFLSIRNAPILTYNPSKDRRLYRDYIPRWYEYIWSIFLNFPYCWS